MAVTACLRVVTGLIFVVTVVATSPADARKPQKAKLSTEQSIIRPDGKPVVEQKRDPADIALDRRMKGICRGC